MKFFCFDCEHTFDEPSWVTGYIHLGEIGTIRERWGVCPQCGSESIEEGHDCGNPECRGVAFDNDELCEECQQKLFHKFLTFMDTLSPAETKALNRLTDGEYLDEFADTLRKRGE